jgi:hypothetical protein
MAHQCRSIILPPAPALPRLSHGTLCVAGIACLPMQVVKGGGGMDLFVYFQIVMVVMSIKTKDLNPPLTKLR